jgi:cytoskeleton-associated protein 5
MKIWYFIPLKLQVSTKWKERKEALDALLEILSAQKFEDGRYGELVNTLGKRMNDSNILVVTLAADSIAKLALGLGQAFAQYKSLVLTSEG